MLKINKIEFAKFLDENLKFGKKGFEDFTYNFDAFLSEAEEKRNIGNGCYELTARETKSGLPECFYFDEVKIFIIQDREAGNVIDECYSLESAEETLAQFEAEDKKDGNYTENFYEIVEI